MDEHSGIERLMMLHRGSLSFGCAVLENAFTRAGCITLGDDGLEGSLQCLLHSFY